MNYFLKKHKAIAVLVLVAFMMTMVMPAFAATGETLTVVKTFAGIPADQIPEDLTVNIAAGEKEVAELVLVTEM